MRHHQSHSALVMAAVATAVAALALILLQGQGKSVGLLALVTVACVLCYLSGRLGKSVSASRSASQRAAAAADSALHLVTETSPDPLQHYYQQLLASLDHTWRQFQQDLRHTDESLHSVTGSLGKALDLARNTGMMAVNAMVSAASCGEVGRGFVSVSQDLIDISERSGHDLEKLRQLVRTLGAGLGRHALLLEQPLDFWMVSSAGLPVAELVKLRSEIDSCHKQLRFLSEHYRNSPQLDVRWLQLGDAVKRLLNELINTLYQLELHLDDVLSDMRLLKLAESPGATRQIVEIKDRMHS